MDNVPVRGMPLGLSSRARGHLLNTTLSVQQLCTTGALLVIQTKEVMLAGRRGAGAAAAAILSLQFWLLAGHCLLGILAGMDIKCPEPHACWQLH